LMRQSHLTTVLECRSGRRGPVRCWGARWFRKAVGPDILRMPQIPNVRWDDWPSKSMGNRLTQGVLFIEPSQLQSAFLVESVTRATYICPMAGRAVAPRPHFNKKNPQSVTMFNMKVAGLREGRQSSRRATKRILIGACEIINCVPPRACGGRNVHPRGRFVTRGTPGLSLSRV
jgi:hypothetical protein